MDECAHPIQVGGLCAICGKEIDECVNANSSTFGPTFATLHSSSSVKVSRDEAERIDRESTTHLIRSRKLALIVDLDQTIIHATVDPIFGEWARNKSHPNWAALSDVVAFQLGIDGVTVTSEPVGIDPNEPGSFATGGEEGGCWYFVKKRPGLDEFLSTLNSLFELHVYTMGARSYAECICRIVDPTGKIFGSRILTRDENDSQMHKSLARLFPVNTSMVAIIDDRADVWGWSPNLIKVHPFEFFLGVGDINGANLSADPAVVPLPEGSAAAEQESAAKPEVEASKIPDESPSDDPPAVAETSVAQSDAAEEPELATDDKELVLVEDVLKMMHSRWFAAHERKANPDVQVVLGEIKHGVLDGCELAFSSLIPLGEEPEQSAVWRHAEEYGARCHHGITRHVTHLVAANPGTAKTEEAHNVGVKVVWPSWLNDSICRWARQPEGPYLIPWERKPAAPVAPDPALGDPNALDKIATMDWGEAEDEVDAFLDDEDEDSEVRSSVDPSRETTPIQDGTPSKRRKVGVQGNQSKLRYSAVFDDAPPASDDNFLDDFADEMERELEDD